MFMSSRGPTRGSGANTDAHERRQPPWIRIRLKRLPRLLARGWVWSSLPLEGRQCLVLKSPRGAIWQFKLGSGAWLRRVTQTNNTRQHDPS